MRRTSLVRTAGRLLCLVLTALVALGLGSWAGEVCDFENLLPNRFIDGQDNWRDRPGQGQGVVQVLAKPIDLAELTSVVQRHTTGDTPVR